MDVELLSKIIGELIVSHDQVGLPGVGTFVAEVVPATFSDKGYAVNPPYRRLSFHPSRLEDRLLIDFYAEANGVDRDAAKAYILQFLSDLKAVLKDRKTILFPGLGRLRATRENNFFFVQDEDLDIFPEGFGLATVSLKTHSGSQEPKFAIKPQVQDEVEEVVAEAPQSEAPIAETPDDEVAVDTLVEEVVAEAPQSEASIVETPADEVAVDTPAEELTTEAKDLQPETPIADISAEDETPQPETPQPATSTTIEATASDDNSADNKPEETVALSTVNTEVTQSRKSPKRKWRWLLILAIVLLSLAVVALIAFFVLVQAAPDLIDSILYTPEELRIINS